jgi:hypothetical protein
MPDNPGVFLLPYERPTIMNDAVCCGDSLASHFDADCTVAVPAYDDMDHRRTIKPLIRVR